mmetsp:Transcript_17475/g.56383  ORF Transcript_17475/g.56383 Transcript_17475/m.56383 type:complete len:205 (+) Transcript_17475:451-1065(+)
MLHLVPLLLQVAAVYAHHAAHGQAERLPRLQHLDVEEGGGGEQAVPQRRQLVAQPDQVPHHHQLERLLLPLVGLVRYVPVQPAQKGDRRRRRAREPQPSALTRVDGALAALVHVLHPRPHAGDLVVGLHRQVHRADVREPLEVKAALPVRKRIAQPHHVRVGEDEVESGLGQHSRVPPLERHLAPKAVLSPPLRRRRCVGKARN